MVARCSSVAFEGIEAREVDVQCQLSAGTPGFGRMESNRRGASTSGGHVSRSFTTNPSQSGHGRPCTANVPHWEHSPL